jgi:azurin
MLNFSRLMLALLLSMSLWACGGSDGSSSASTGAEAGTSASEESAVPGTIELTIEGNDQMRYNKERMEVYAGQTVKVTLRHVGELPVEAMGHNWVLLNQGTDMESFAMNAIEAKDNGYIPAGSEGKVIAHTEMIGGGQETTVEFQAPAPGTYDFICTFPGHYGFMQGSFVVKEA